MTSKPIYKMSGAGKCPKALSAERLGYEPKEAPKWLEDAAEEGKLHEGWIVNKLESQGYTIGGRQQEVILEYPQFNLVGHIDGIAAKDDKTYLLEIKTMSHFEFQRWMKEGFSGFSTYADQISLYYHALYQSMLINGILYAVKNRSNGYRDDSIMTTPPSDFELVISKLIAVEKSVAEGKLYEADFDPSSIECKRCGYRDSICIANKEQLEPALEKTLLEAVKLVREGNALIADGKTLYDEGKKTLANHAEAVSPEKKHIFDINNMHVSRFNVRRVSYPKANIESAFSKEVYEPLQKVSEYWQTNVTDLTKEIENE